MLFIIIIYAITPGAVPGKLNQKSEMELCQNNGRHHRGIYLYWQLHSQSQVNSKTYISSASSVTEEHAMQQDTATFE